MKSNDPRHALVATSRKIARLRIRMQVLVAGRQGGRWDERRLNDLVLGAFGVY
jgi:hypothetical protein